MSGPSAIITWGWICDPTEAPDTILSAKCTDIEVGVDEESPLAVALDPPADVAVELAGTGDVAVQIDQEAPTAVEVVQEAGVQVSVEPVNDTEAKIKDC